MGLGGSVALWLCGSVALWLCGSVPLWLCGSVSLWLCSSVALRLCGSAALRRCGSMALSSVALWLCGSLALGLCGSVCTCTILTLCHLTLQFQLPCCLLYIMHLVPGLNPGSPVVRLCFSLTSRCAGAGVPLKT